MTRIPFRLAIPLLSTSLLAAGVAAHPDDSAAKKEPGPEKTREVKARDLTLKIPVSWKEQPPTSRMRLAQFEIPPVEGDKEPGELVFYYFPGGAGGVKANLERWIGQFDEKGRKVRLTKGKSAQGAYYVADVTGAYNKPIGPPIRRQSKLVPGSRLLAVVLEAGDAKYYIKLTGPQKTITAVAAQFRRSFGGDAKKEEPFEL